MEVPPKSSILMGFSIVNPPFWATPIYGNLQKVNGNYTPTYNLAPVVFFVYANSARNQPSIPSTVDQIPVFHGISMVFPWYLQAKSPFSRHPLQPDGRDPAHRCHSPWRRTDHASHPPMLLLVTALFFGHED